MRFPNLDPSVWRKLSLLSTTDMLTLFAKINGAVDVSSALFGSCDVSQTLQSSFVYHSLN